MSGLLGRTGTSLKLAVLVSAAAVLGCSQTRGTSSEGVVCSTSEDADPHFTCDIEYADLVCIYTYKVADTKAFVCRVACDSNDDCPDSADICCQGEIYGETFGKMKGCVPSLGMNFCQTDPNVTPEKRDAMPRPPSDAGADANMTPIDANMTPVDANDPVVDASVDVPSGDADDRD
jgi:hypothetical protein